MTELLENSDNTNESAVVSESPANETTISLAAVQALADALQKIESYTPTVWVDNSSPDIDAEHLNKPEQAIKRVTDALNSAVDVIKDLQSQVTKNSGAISDVNNNLESGYLKIKVYGSCIRLVQKTVSFTNGIGYIPLSEIFESFNPKYAIGVSQPIDLESEGIALVSVSKDGNNMKIALNKSYTGTKWVSFIAIGSL